MTRKDLYLAILITNSTIYNAAGHLLLAETWAIMALMFLIFV